MTSGRPTTFFKDCFATIENEGSPVISIEDFKSILLAAGFDVSVSDVTALLSIMGSEGNMINYQEVILCIDGNEGLWSSAPDDVKVQLQKFEELSETRYSLIVVC